MREHETNKQLWGLVREEAIYFGLDSLIQLLRITFSCSPEVEREKVSCIGWEQTKVHQTIKIPILAEMLQFGIQSVNNGL